MPTQPLFTPYRMGDLILPNRIVMAPLTRMRAQPHEAVSGIRDHLAFYPSRVDAIEVIC